MAQYAVHRLELPAAVPVVAALLARNVPGLSEQAAARKVREAYLDDPAGVGAVFGLVAAPSTGPEAAAATPVGALCLQARSLCRGSQAFPATVLADFCVDAAHRSLGPALSLVRTAIAGVGTPAVFGFPNPQARGLLQRAGLAPLGRLQRRVKLLSTRALRHRGGGWLRRCAAYGHRGLDPLLAAADRWLAWRHARGWSARPAGFGEAWVDTVWSGREAAVLVSLRDARTLAWRYGSDLKRDWRLARIDDAQGAPSAHVVWRMHGDIAEIGDVFARGLDGPAAAPVGTATARGLLAALLAFVPLARREGATALSLELLGPAPLQGALRRAGLLAHAEGDPAFGRLAEAMGPRDALVLTGLDRDTH